MDFTKLRKLSERNEVRVDDFRGHSRTPPFYYDSLRHAFGFYFNTFNTKNESYDFYAQGLAGRNVKILKGQFLDEDNTVLTLVAFERYFELFIKDVLRKTHQKLVCIPDPTIRAKTKTTIQLINQIQTKSFVGKKFDKKLLTIPFRESLNRFYDLFSLSKSPSVKKTNSIVRKFARVVKSYAFLDSKDYQSSLQLLNWYRDRILHNGNKLPSLWLLDYLITQRIVPIVYDIVQSEKAKLDESLFYFETVTKINVLKKLNEVKFNFKDLKNERKFSDVYSILLYIGHLKELGRASMNMNLFVRNNWQATYEYNYKDPKGRGKRFAEAEKMHPDFKAIKKCPCCGEESLVVYQIQIKDIFNPKGGLKNIDWMKCYTCDYHLRYNVGDPHLFDLSSDKIFQ